MIRGQRGPRLLLAVTLLFVLTAGCSLQAAEPPPQPTAEPVDAIETVAVEGGGFYVDVQPAGLKRMLARKDFLLINVHIPYEGEIEPTDSFIPYNRIHDNLGQLPQDKDKRIVLYCRSGPMSEKAARILVREGYTDVWNLQGGMNAWRQAGFAVVNKPR